MLHYGEDSTMQKAFSGPLVCYSNLPQTVSLTENFLVILGDGYKCKAHYQNKLCFCDLFKKFLHLKSSNIAIIKILNERKTNENTYRDYLYPTFYRMCQIFRCYNHRFDIFDWILFTKKI